MIAFNKTSRLTQYYVCFSLAAVSVCSLSPGLRAEEMTSATPKQLNTLSQKNSQQKNAIAPTPQTIPSKPYSWTNLSSFGQTQKQTLRGQQLPTQNIPVEIIAQAQPNSDAIPKKSQKNLPSRFYIGPDFFHRNYKEEEITPGFKSNEFGTLFGLQASYDYVKAKSVYVGLGFRYGGGQTTYDGSLQDGTPATSTTDNRFLNIEGRLGYTFQGGKTGRFLFSPFVGLGYHNWNRDISENQTIDGVQEIGVNTIENYSWGYVGPGFHAEYKVTPRFDVGLNAKLMVMLGGRITLEDKFQGETIDQGSGSLGSNLQYEIELPLTFHLLEKPQTGIDLKITPYYRSQDIARGKPFVLDTGDSVVEPASTTSVYGVTAGIQFRF